MADDLRLNSSISTSADLGTMSASADIPGDKPKKKSGCGCFLGGCFSLLLFIFLPIITGSIYISNMSDAEWGAKIVSVVKNPDFSSGIKQSIQGSSKLSEVDKQNIINLYEHFLTEYDKLPPQKQEVINKNIFVVIKKIFSDPKGFGNDQPAELTEIIAILGIDDNATTPPINTTTTTTPPVTNSNNQNTTNNSFDFGTTNNVNTNGANQNTAPLLPQTTTQPKNPTNYDF